MAMTVAILAACSSTKDPRRVPTPLTQFKPALEVKQAWKASVGKSKGFLFQPAISSGFIYAAGANGSIAKFDATSGRSVWHTKVKEDLTAGVGVAEDGSLLAVGAQDGYVIVLDGEGKRLWSGNVGGEILTAPLIGHNLVLVRTADGRITAFDALTGEQKWVYRNRAVPLNLRTTLGMRFAGANGILAGFPGGSMAAVNIDNGDPFWQSAVSYPQGVTEVERINDVSGAPELVGRLACAGSFQGRLGCFDVENGQPVWQHPFSTYNGVAEDAQMVVAGDDYSVVSAFDANTGRLLWENKELRARDLSRPVLLGHAVVVGDYKGFVHFLSTDNGQFVARMKTDGDPITAPAVVSGDSLIVQTSSGDLYAFQPQ
ncbi:outer membrane protein assembly factor BamB [Robbsia sp. KACC 23696]|uniref:outer membrane protein assembly factor BamB n=1 Tax=Robbsia sp. KACC 23696 TaxID=3149231 RepID=UPI00325A6240